MQRLVLVVIGLVLAAAVVVLVTTDSAPPDSAAVNDDRNGPAATAELASEPAAQATSDAEPARPAPQPKNSDAPELVERQAVAPDEDMVVVRARLVDEAQTPVAGATFGFFARDETEGLALRDMHRVVDFFRVLEGERVQDSGFEGSVSDSSGEASIAIPADELQQVVFAFAPGRQIATSFVEFEGVEEEYDAGVLELPPAAELTVRVLDPAGEPAEMAYVAVRGSKDWSGAPTHQAIDQELLLGDSEGSCRFTHVIAGKVTVEAQLGDSSITRQSAEVAVDTENELTVRLESGESLSGKVRTARGEPAPEVEVFIKEELDGGVWNSPLASSLSGIPAAHTDASGAFRCTGLRSDATYEVRAVASRQVDAQLTGVRPGERVEITLPAAGSLHGRLVRKDGTPVEGARVMAVESEDHSSRPSFIGMGRRDEDLPQTDASGSFNLQIRDGSYRLVFSHPEGEVVHEGPFELESESDTGDLMLPRGGILEIQFVSAADGSPVADASARLSAPNSGPGAFDGQSWDPGEIEDLMRLQQVYRDLNRARPDPAEPVPGTLRWEGLKPGSHQLRVIAAGYAPLEVEAQIEAGRTITLRESLSTGCQLRVKAYLPDGKPAVNASFRIHSSEGERFGFQPNSYARTDATGVAEFKDLKADRYEVLGDSDFFFGKERKPLATVTLKPGKNECEVILPEEWSVEVFVTDGERPVEGVEVRVEPGDRIMPGAETLVVDFGSSMEKEKLKTDMNGHAIVDGLHAGFHVAEVRRPGGQKQTEKFELSRNGQRLDFVLAGLSISGRVLDAPADSTVLLRRITEEAEQMRKRLAGTGMEHLYDAFHDRRAVVVRAECDESGGFRFVDLEPGKYSLRASADGLYQPDPFTVVLEEQDLDGVTLRVAPEGRLTLRVKGLDSFGMRFFTARVVDESGQVRGPSLMIHQGQDYPVRGLAPGRYTLQVYDMSMENIQVGKPELELDAEFPVSISAEHEEIVEWTAPE